MKKDSQISDKALAETQESYVSTLLGDGASGKQSLIPGKIGQKLVSAINAKKDSPHSTSRDRFNLNLEKESGLE